jgi:tetratricopeptide (TPR) repeat protein
MAKISDSIDRGIRFAENGDYPRALETLKGLYERFPDNPDVLYNYGRFLNDMRDFGEARSVLELLVSLAPEYRNARVALAFAYLHLKRTDEARALLEDARETDSGNTFLLRNLGSIYANDGKPELALEAFREAERAEPASRPVLYGIALVLMKLDRPGEASVYLEKIIDQDVDDEIDRLARDCQRKISEKEFSKDGIRMDAVFYCLAALEAYEEMSFGQIQSTTFEIAMLGREGLDPSDPSRNRQLRSVPGDFSALQLLCFMYVGFKLVKPEVDIGFDLSKEYDAAETMFQARHGQGHGS